MVPMVVNGRKVRMVRPTSSNKKDVGLGPLLHFVSRGSPAGTSRIASSHCDPVLPGPSPHPLPVTHLHGKSRRRAPRPRSKWSRGLGVKGRRRAPGAGRGVGGTTDRDRRVPVQFLGSTHSSTEGSVPRRYRTIGYLLDGRRVRDFRLLLPRYTIRGGGVGYLHVSWWSTGSSRRNPSNLCEDQTLSESFINYTHTTPVHFTVHDRRRCTVPVCTQGVRVTPIVVERFQGE